MDKGYSLLLMIAVKSEDDGRTIWANRLVYEARQESMPSVSDINLSYKGELWTVRFSNASIWL